MRGWTRLEFVYRPWNYHDYFYKNPNFKDAMVRFDFRFDEAKDIRLVTGASGQAVQCANALLGLDEAISN